MRKLIIVLCACMLVPAAVALAAVTGTFRGHTSKGGAVTIHVKNGVIPKKPQSIFYYKAHCHSGAILSGATFIDGKLHRGNSFSVVGGKDTVPVAGGYMARHTVTVRFTIKGKKASGTFNNSAKILKKGKVVDRCGTGKLTFTAKK